MGKVPTKIFKEKGGRLKKSFKRLNGILLVDVETTNNQKHVIEVSFARINNKGIRTEKHNYIIKEMWESKRRYGRYSNEKIDTWKQHIELGLIEVIPIKELRDKIEGVENVDIFSAYNVNFDIQALNITFKLFGLECNKLNKLKKFCLWHYSKSIYSTKEYITWALNKKALTPTGKISTNAENIYRYICEQYNFQETHVAHEDLDIEEEILKSALITNMSNRNNWLDLEKNGSWQTVEKTRKEMGL